MRVHQSVASLWLVMIAGLVGCRMGVPIHVWQPAGMASAVGQRVAVSQLAGPQPIADRVHQRLIDQTPDDAGRELVLVDADELQQESPIRLVSATDQEMSDVALASVARRRGFDFALHGQILEPRSAASATETPERLTISWRLTDLSGDRAPVGLPVSVDLKTAMELYPDLTLLTDPEAALVAAAARETYRLLAPSVTRVRAQLAIPYLTPGSRQVRRGNALATSGDWHGARQMWRQALAQHPTQTTALVNLAVAAVAAQEFPEARRLAKEAVRRHPSKLARQNLVWVERMQRHYHRSFDLPEPAEGWVLTRDTDGPAASGR